MSNRWSNTGRGDLIRALTRDRDRLVVALRAIVNARSIRGDVNVFADALALLEEFDCDTQTEPGPLGEYTTYRGTDE